MATFAEIKARDNYSAVTLATIEPAYKETSWAPLGGNLYEAAPLGIVSRVSFDGVEGVADATPDANLDWTYSLSTGKLTVFCDSDVSDLTVVVWVKLFFASRPVTLPYDLSTGALVPWKPFISNVSSFSQALDGETRHVPFESQGSLELHNDFEFFRSKIRKLTWENKEVRVYRWSTESTAIDPELLYIGYITETSYSKDSIGFTFSNQMRKLKASVSVCDYFDSDDGFGIPAEQYLTLKRIPFGRVSGYTPYQTNQVVGPITSDKTFTTTSGSKVITAAGGYILTEIFEGDAINIGSDSYTVITHGRIDWGESEASFTFGSTASAFGVLATISCDSVNFGPVNPGDFIVIPYGTQAQAGIGIVAFRLHNGLAYSLLGANGYYDTVVTLSPKQLFFYKLEMDSLTVSPTPGKNVDAYQSATVTRGSTRSDKNHQFMLSPIPLFSLEATITSVVGPKITVDQIRALSVGDKVKIYGYDGVFTLGFIDRDSSEIRMEEALPTSLAPGDTLTLQKVSSVYYQDSKGQKMWISDYATTSDDFGEYLEVSPLVFEELSSSQGSGEIRHRFVLAKTPAFRDARIADMIRVNGDSYRIIEKLSDYAVLIDEGDLLNGFHSFDIISVKDFDNSTKVYVDCYGVADEAGNFIETPFDLTRYLLHLAGVPYDSTVFQGASEEFSQLLSCTIPFNYGDRDIPKYRDIIEQMCVSSHSVLFINADGEFTTSPLFKTRTVASETLVADTDILEQPNFSIDNKAAANTVTILYGVGDDSYGKQRRKSDDSTYLERTSASLPDLHISLYSSRDAETFGDRELLLRSGSRTELVFEVSQKVDLSFLNVAKCDFRCNPIIERITDDSTIQGIITSYEIGANSVVTVTVDDLCGLFDKTGVIAPNTLLDYSVSSNEDEQAYCWIDDGSVIQ